MAVLRMRTRTTIHRTRTRTLVLGLQTIKNRSVMPQKYSGVQQQGRVPNVEPVGMSLSNSVSNHGKLEKKAWDGVW